MKNVNGSSFKLVYSSIAKFLASLSIIHYLTYDILI